MLDDAIGKVIDRRCTGEYPDQDHVKVIFLDRTTPKIGRVIGETPGFLVLDAGHVLCIPIVRIERVIAGV